MARKPRFALPHYALHITPAPNADAFNDGDERKTQTVSGGDDELVGWVVVEVFEGGDDAGGERLQVDARVLCDLREQEVEGSRNLVVGQFGKVS